LERLGFITDKYRLSKKAVGKWRTLEKEGRGVREKERWKKSDFWRGNPNNPLQNEVGGLFKNLGI
jgi:hypothetical protein